MTTPRSELIDQNVLTTVAGITTAAGYNATLTAKMFDPNQEIPPADLLAVVFAGDDLPEKDEMTPTDYTPISAQQWLRPIFVIVYLLKSNSDQTPWPTWRNTIRADVEKAMLADRNRGHDTNNVQLAVDTYAMGCDTFEDADDAKGVIVKFIVKYRTTENDPYAAF